jgi:hypothetical protein
MFGSEHFLMGKFYVAKYFEISPPPRKIPNSSDAIAYLYKIGDTLTGISM